ncbi:hypothetical protein [Streptomyces sennicomposti]
MATAGVEPRGVGVSGVPVDSEEAGREDGEEDDDPQIEAGLTALTTSVVDSRTGHLGNSR